MAGVPRELEDSEKKKYLTVFCDEDQFGEELSRDEVPQVALEMVEKYIEEV